MNKQEFIDYIEKLPNEIDFTPMTVQVKAECPHPDGSYRTITKNIKFECTYNSMVHQLPDVPAKHTGTSFGGTLENVVKFWEEKFAPEPDEFYRHINKLKDDICNVISPLYGDCFKNWGGIPIFVLSYLLTESLKITDESLPDDVLKALENLKDFLNLLEDSSPSQPDDCALYLL